MAIDRISNDMDLKQYLDKRKGIPLVVLYGMEGQHGVELDFVKTKAFEEADEQLTDDIIEAVVKMAEQLEVEQ